MNAHREDPILRARSPNLGSSRRINENAALAGRTSKVLMKAGTPPI